MDGSGIVIVDDEVFYTLLDELFPDDDDLFEADEHDHQVHENRDAGEKDGDAGRLIGIASATSIGPIPSAS